MENKPMLLISHYSVKTTREMFNKLKEEYGDSFEVEMLPSIPSDPTKLADYYKELKRVTRDLADGKTKILVSSGSLGIGANIIKTDGSFPDMRVGILGLPENESQLRQNLGRRRARGSEYFWITDKQSMRERATLLDNQSGMLVKAYLTQEKAESIIDGTTQNSPENLKFALRLIHDAHVSTGTNEEFTVAYDVLFRSEILPMAQKYLINRIQRTYFDKGSDLLGDPDAQRRLKVLVDMVGLPDSLYERLLEPDVTLGIQSANTRDYIEKLKIRITENDMVKNIVESWFQMVRGQSEYVDREIYANGRQHAQQFYFNQAPQGSSFNGVSQATIHLSGDTEKPIDLGTVRIKDKDVPSARFIDGSIYLIGNVRVDQLDKVNDLYLYTKGSRNVMFMPLVT
jgi:hypothetical protein